MTDKTEAPELKPCPLCGGEASTHDEWRCIDDETLIVEYVSCDKCGLEMNSLHHDGFEAAWNTRTPSPVCAEVRKEGCDAGRAEAQGQLTKSEIEEALWDCVDEGTFEYSVNSDAVIKAMVNTLIRALNKVQADG